MALDVAASIPEQYSREERARHEREQHDEPGEAERPDEDVGDAGGIVRRLDQLDDDRRLFLLYQNFSNASSASVRTATPLGPLGRNGLASSTHAVPAMSRCAHGRLSVNSFRNSAAVIEPAGRPPVFIMSAISLFSCSR